MSSFAKQLSISIIVSYTCSISAWYLYTCYVKFYKAKKIPTKWKRVGRVEKLILYPLKSGTSKEVTQAMCTDLGLREIEEDSSRPTRHLFRDRSFVIYDVQTQKAIRTNKNPKVLLISLDSIDDDRVVFKAPGIEDLILNLSVVVETLRHRRVQITNYATTFEAVDCGDEVAQWLSKYFAKEGESFRLAYFAENLLQRPDPIGCNLKKENGFSSTYKHWRKNDGGVFSDLTSYMILSSSSVQDLNDKLTAENRFSYRNLRANIIVEGSEKYAEDNWKWIRIGENIVFRTVKFCTRCAVITIDPATATRNENVEPLKTLRSYRTVNHLTGQKLEGDNGVLGILVGLYEGGKIRLGDPIYVDE